MPAIVDKLYLKDKALKKSAKLLDCQVERIIAIHAEESKSISGLARMFNVSKRTIQFILFPERKARNIELRKARGGSKIYYDKEKHTEATRKHRQYKKILIPKDNDKKA